ncbi:MAG: hypothetical protein AAGK28_15605 [Pseudomonadota bacterium]
MALILGLVGLGPIMGSAQPWPTSPSERVQVFATCAGRLSAFVDHQRTIGGLVPEQLETQRGNFEALLSATIPDAVDYGLPQAQAMDWQIHAKLAQSRLLMRADFYGDAIIKAKAREAAEAFLRECDRFLLG